MALRPNTRYHIRRYVLPWILITGSLACASESLPPRLYDVTTETGMPHLEENLRYAVTRARRCLAQQDLRAAFPILDHPALNGCHLDRETREGDRITYALVCEGGHGTTGDAVWDLGQHQITGTLHVKLGGKNMTFYQRLTAKPVGACA
jgi:hypothetical protein